jgi:ubiquitin carboxyl-terminal hydrolase 25/28
MMQNPYHLHAIMVHEGTTDSGHYFAFIFDRNKKKWYRFNDYKVCEVEEFQVFDESFGNTQSNKR